MEEFKKYLLQLVGTIEWQDEEKCKDAAKDIMDHFSEASGNMVRSIIMNSIYQGLYSGFDAVTDILKEKGIDGNNLWTALHNDVIERYDEKPLVKLLAILSIMAQEARCYNDMAFKKYKETKAIDEAMVFSAVERLVKMRPFALGIPVDQYSLDPDISSFSKRISAAIFANTFRQFDLEMYNKDQIHDIFIGFYEAFGKSKTIIDNYGTDLIDCANQLMSQLHENSKYKKKYIDCCETIKRLI
jgi:hypothetical protein